jgi:F-type H+-transporting ATPase subunit alpha
VITIYAGVNGYLDDVPVGSVRRFEAEFVAFVENGHGGILQAIREKKELPNELKQQLDSVIKEFKQRFASEKDLRTKEAAAKA